MVLLGGMVEVGGKVLVGGMVVVVTSFVVTSLLPPVAPELLYSDLTHQYWKVPVDQVSLHEEYSFKLNIDHR